MQASSLLFILLSAIVAFAILAKRFEIPYPIAFVIGGALLALFPNLPQISLSPEWIFLIILPPLLYSGGWLTDWPMFKDNLRPIGLLAIGLVIATTAAVAVVAHMLLPQMTWAAGFALGAIISPPDAVAAGAVFERFSVPRRIVAILEGEGLVNDATALVIYRFAVAAVLTGTFSPVKAGGALLFVAIGGLAAGLIFGFLYTRMAEFFHRTQLTDYQLANVMSLVVPYAVYLSAESLHVSGVLATVAAGMYASRRSAKMFGPEARLVASSVWDLLIFLFNGLVFLLIGLQLRTIVHDPSFLARHIWIGALMSALVIAVRVVWVFPATYLPRWLSRRVAVRDPLPPWRYVFLISWSGMRGIVSLAAALALPLSDSAGHPFPARNEIVFITFCVIFTTLVLQGLSLIPIVKWLRIDAGSGARDREIEVRVAALRAGIARVRQLEPDFESTTEWEIQGRIVADYEYRIAHLLRHGEPDGELGAVNVDHRMQNAALEAERDEIMRLREVGEIPDEVYRKVEYDLDLAFTRMT